MVGVRLKQAWFQDKLTEAVMSLCRQGNMYTTRAKVEGTICVVCDDNDVIVAHITESFFGNIGSSSDITSSVAAGASPRTHSRPTNITTTRTHSADDDKTPRIQHSNDLTRTHRHSHGIIQDMSHERSNSKNGVLSQDHKKQVSSRSFYGQNGSHKQMPSKVQGFKPERSAYNKFVAHSQGVGMLQGHPVYDHMALAAVHADGRAIHKAGNSRQNTVERQHRAKEEYHLPVLHNNPTVSHPRTEAHSGCRNMRKGLSRSQDTHAEYVMSTPNHAQLTTVYSSHPSQFQPINMASGHQGMYGRVTAASHLGQSASLVHTSTSNMMSEKHITPYSGIDDLYSAKGEGILDSYVSSSSQSDINPRPGSNHKCPYCERTFPTSSKLWKHIRNENCTSKTAGSNVPIVNIPKKRSAHGNLSDVASLPSSGSVRETQEHKEAIDSANVQSSGIGSPEYSPQIEMTPSPVESPTNPFIAASNSHIERFGIQAATVTERYRATDSVVKVKMEEVTQHDVQEGEDILEVSSCPGTQKMTLDNQHLVEDEINNNHINKHAPEAPTMYPSVNCGLEDTQGIKDEETLIPKQTLKTVGKINRSRTKLRPSLLSQYRRLHSHPKKRFSLLGKGHQKLVTSRTRMHSTGP